MPRGKHLVSYKACSHPGPWRAISKSADGLSAYGICGACEGRAEMTRKQLKDYEADMDESKPMPKEWATFTREAKP